MSIPLSTSADAEGWPLFVDSVPDPDTLAWQYRRSGNDADPDHSLWDVYEHVCHRRISFG
jgi:hypothetical protein